MSATKDAFILVPYLPDATGTGPCHGAGCLHAPGLEKALAGQAAFGTDALRGAGKKRTPLPCGGRSVREGSERDRERGLHTRSAGREAPGKPGGGPQGAEAPGSTGVEGGMPEQVSGTCRQKAETPGRGRGKVGECRDRAGHTPEKLQGRPAHVPERSRKERSAGRKVPKRRECRGSPEDLPAARCSDRAFSLPRTGRRRSSRPPR